MQEDWWEKCVILNIDNGGVVSCSPNTGNFLQNNKLSYKDSERLHNTGSLGACPHWYIDMTYGSLVHGLDQEKKLFLLRMIHLSSLRAIAYLSGPVVGLSLIHI